MDCNTESADAFAELVAPHVPELWRVARRRLGGDDLAGEAVQESLLALWRSEQTPLEPRPWLIRAVLNRCLLMGRTLRRRRLHEDRAARTDWGAGEPECPHRQLERHQLAGALAAAIAALAPEQRCVFLLRELDGADYQTIARTLAIPVGTVRSRLHRARTGLQTHLSRVDVHRGALAHRHARRSDRLHHA
jgi:RNA polymerase sigma-70 factor (ECF subfamily)